MISRWPVLLLAVALLATGCGGSSGAQPAGSSSSAAAVGTGEPSGALAADAKSAATGDIPDTQNFLTMTARGLHVSMLYPEGWAVKESATLVSIADKNNLVRISVANGPAPTAASAQAELASLRRSTPTLVAGVPRRVALKNGGAVKVTYTTQSAPNPVTGKRVTLTVDRYLLWRAGRLATVDLGTPVGVDNVDAYRRMIESFKWR